MQFALCGHTITNMNSSEYYSMCVDSGAGVRGVVCSAPFVVDEGLGAGGADVEAQHEAAGGLFRRLRVCDVLIALVLQVVLELFDLFLQPLLLGLERLDPPLLLRRLLVRV